MSSGRGPTQARLSSFFPSTVDSNKQNATAKKRPTTPIDLTSETEEEPVPRKRQRVEEHAASFQTSSTATHEDWRFSPVKSAIPSAKSTEQQKRHEAFKRKLLADNSLFPPKSHTDSTLPEDAPDFEEDDREDDVALPDDIRALASSTSAKGKAKAKPPPRKKKQVEIGPSGEPYTPLELQIRDLIKEYPGTVLVVEVGYKYKFFGKDAEVARKELGMVSYVDRNFLVASIPTHRRDVHLKKLLAQGYRVGIVEQIETAALKKAGDNKSGPFERKLTGLYTAATYVDHLDSIDELERFSPPLLMCLVEETKGKNTSDVSVGILTITPSTGDVVWDDFDDTALRLELETRLVHLRPSELLLPRTGLTETTEKMLSHFRSTTSMGSHTRADTFDKVKGYTQAYGQVSKFYMEKREHALASETFKSGKLLAELTDFPPKVVIALAHAIEHLSAFGVADAFLETKFFSKFASRVHMLLAANTLTNLEVYRNDTDDTVKGSLIWVLDRTKTKFGARLLHNWVGRPLVDKRALTERVDAVQEIMESDSERLRELRQLLNRLPDLARGLSRIQYGKCTSSELAELMVAFKKLGDAYIDVDGPDSVGLESPVLNGIIAALPRLRTPVKKILDDIHLKDARDNKLASLWRNPDKFSELEDAKGSIHLVEYELEEELKKIRKQLRMPSLKWETVANDEYLVVVQRSENRPIPEKWILMSKTKKVARYRTPEVQAKLAERAQWQETMEGLAKQSYRLFLQEISQEYYAVLRDAVNKLAMADCLISLALVAMKEGYVRPEFTDDDRLEITDGRHPMIEELRTTPYIANSVSMGNGTAKSKIVTGPNMGGKSSCVRMVALIALMAQIGSYVPAGSVKMGLIDSILTRMGASDDLARGRSTFMVEMSETSEILKTATSKSLVILDELGRGTSTFDGMAIAEATLEHLVHVGCKTLFITHYPLVATKLERKYPSEVENLHMGYEAYLKLDGTRLVTFLYKLTRGITSESFGIECARLATIPEPILHAAVEHSARLRTAVEGRAKRNKVRKALQLMKKYTEGNGSAEVMEEFKSIAASLIQQ